MKSPKFFQWSEISGHCIDRNRIDAGRFFDYQGRTTKEEYKELVRKGAVGEIVGRIYDKNGQTVDEDLKRKMVGISLDKIAKILSQSPMSYGKDKIEAIKGAIVLEQ